MAREVLLPKTELHFMLIPDLNAYASVDTTPDFTLTSGDEYVVVWGSDEFTRTAFSFTQEDGSENGAKCIAVGNTVATGGSDNGDPFAVVYDATNSRMYYFSTDDTESRFVSVYRSCSDGIAIRDPHGTRVTYGEYDKIRVNRGSGAKTIYSMGEAEGKIINEEELDFSKGNMTIKPEYGKLWNEVEIVVPEALIPANIAKGITIAGVEGVHEGGGSIDLEGELLNYIAYRLDIDENLIIIYGILFDKLYKDTGSYDLAIPDMLGQYQVVIASEGVS